MLKILNNVKVYFITPPKLLFKSSILILTLLSICQCSKEVVIPNQIEIEAYDIKVNLDLNNLLNLNAKLEILKKDSIDKFELLLSSEAKIESIKSKIKNDWIDISYTRNKDTLVLTIPSEIVSNRELIIEFNYTFPTGEIKDVLYFDRGHRWYPLIIDQIARFKLTAEVPFEYEVFSVGDLISRKKLNEYSQFIWESKIPVFKLPIIIAKTGYYQKTYKECNSKEIYFYSLIKNKEIIEEILSEACNTMKFFNEHIGEYHHNQLTIIEFPEFQGTNIATSLLIIGSQLFDFFKKGYYENLHFSIACQWIAAGTFNKLFGKGFWFLQISLPHYLRLMYLRQTKEEDAYIKALQKGLVAYKEIANSDKDVPLIDIDFPDSPEKGKIIYGKGPYIIDQVCIQIGEKNWEKLIKDIYKDFKGRIFNYNDFISYLSKYDEDGTCVPKFEKMLSERGIPDN
ncbi:MAG: hypothetical protein KAW92_05320 [Candidatus Cloacimonetes bacterium]|nr:hypothetical protein [Candidatus Cloacimonadota bacterium]